MPSDAIALNAEKKPSVLKCPATSIRAANAARKWFNERREEYMTSLPYFVVPDNTKDIIGEKPKKLMVIPAYNSINRTIPNSYARYTQNGAIYCTGDGVSASVTILIQEQEAKL